MEPCHTSTQRPRPPHRLRHLVVQRRGVVQGAPLEGREVAEGPAARLLGVHGRGELLRVVAGPVETGPLALVEAFVIVEHVHLVFTTRQRHLSIHNITG